MWAAGKEGAERGLEGTWGAGGCNQGTWGPESSYSASLSCLPSEFLGGRAAASEQSYQQILGARDAVSHPEASLPLSLSVFPLRLLSGCLVLQMPNMRRL